MFLQETQPKLGYILSMGVFIIAEAGVNHNGSLDVARKLVDVAVDAKADAVKFQTFKAESLAAPGAQMAEYQKKNTGTVASPQVQMLKKLELTHEMHQELVKYCKERGIQFMSTPFDVESLDFLNQRLCLSRFKIASGEITNAQLLLKTAQTGKPCIVSTGMSTLEDIESALGVLAYGYLGSTAKPCMDSFKHCFSSDDGRRVLKKNVVLLHCTSEYPAPFSEIHLKAMDTMAARFGLPVGYSDHTRGVAVSLAAVARGAVVIEKHFTLDQTMDGPDHRASIEPEELKYLVSSIREIEQALGSERKEISKSEAKNKVLVRKSLVAARRIEAGEILNENNLTAMRPEQGVSALYYWDFLGKKASRAYEKNEAIKE